MLLTKKHRLGILCVVLVVLIPIVVHIQIERLAPQQQIYTFDNATVRFEMDRCEVWQEGDCVNLHWEAQNIDRIELMKHATDPVNTVSWCLSDEVSLVVFTVHLTKKQVISLAPFGLYAIRTGLFIILLPFLIVAGWCFSLHTVLAPLFGRLPLRKPFSVAGEVQPLLVVLFLGLNIIVLWNAIYHSTDIQYDAGAHYANVQIISQGRLPTFQESEEYFSPPLPYLLPALTSRFTHLGEIPIRKLGQLQNVLVSLIASYVLLRIGARLYPETSTPRAVSLFLLASLPVYYKTFAMMRGEPFVLMFTLLLCDRLLCGIRQVPHPKE